MEFIVQDKIQVNNKKPKLVEFSNQVDRNEYNYVKYYLTPLKMMYFLCLSPNRIIFSEATQKFELETNSLRNVVCVCVHTLLWILSIPTISGSFSGSVRRNPEDLFKMFNTILWTSNLYILTYQSYLQQDEIQNLLSRPKMKLEESWRRQVAPVLTAFIIILHTIPELFVIPWDLSLHSGDFYFEQNLLRWAHETLRGFSINLTNTRFSDSSLPQQVLLTVSVIFSIMRDIIGYIFYIILLISCLGVYEIAKSIERATEEIQDSNTASIEGHIGQYLIAKSYIEDINKISGPAVLISFTSAISFTAMRFLAIFDGGNVPYGVMLGSFILVWSLGMLLAAEAHAKFKKVRSRLRQYRVARDVKCCKASCDWYPASFYLDSDSDSIGLTGGSFFTVSYSLLGQALSVFLTYLIIIVQFESQKQT